MSRRRLPDPPHVPPTAVEEELGYWFVCSGCGRKWATRDQDARTRQCRPCARTWRRDDMASRRRGLPGVPLHRTPAPHPFTSKVLGRELDLNGEDGRRQLRENTSFRAEVDGYIEQLVSMNEAATRAPLVGVVPLLPRARMRKNAAIQVVVEPEPVAPVVSVAEEQEISNEIDSRLHEIDGEIIE